jgi:hypothetical protein
MRALSQTGSAKGSTAPEEIGLKTAGVSEDQARQAECVASVPAEDFERQVESDAPPTITATAERRVRDNPHGPSVQ